MNKEYVWMQFMCASMSRMKFTTWERFLEENRSKQWGIEWPDGIPCCPPDCEPYTEHEELSDEQKKVRTQRWERHCAAWKDWLPKYRVARYQAFLKEVDGEIENCATWADVALDKFTERFGKEGT